MQCWRKSSKRWWSNSSYSASIEGNLDIVELLLENGADVNQTDKFGRIPLDLAIKPEIKNVLTKWPLQVSQAKKRRISQLGNLL